MYFLRIVKNRRKYTNFYESTIDCILLYLLFLLKILFLSSQPTIHDIAKALSIDSSTVSRALNDSPRVTKHTKERILAKANELGYQRNLLASNLRKKRTNTIGVVVPRISRHFFSSVIQGIEETTHLSGYNVIICQSLENLDREKKIIETLAANRVDGLLISVSMETSNKEHFKVLDNNKIPYVFFDRHLNSETDSNVLIDDFKGGFDATKHLILKGCQKIVHFSGPQDQAIYKNRLLGYRAALYKYGIEFKEEYVLTSRLMEKDGYKSAEIFINTNLTFDAIFAANDLSAIGAMKCLREKKIKVPKEVAIVGFSNEPISSIIEPSLTTIDQSGVNLGVTATNLLFKSIAKKDIFKQETIILQANLIERDSTKK